MPFGPTRTAKVLLLQLSVLEEKTLTQLPGTPLSRGQGAKPPLVSGSLSLRLAGLRRNTPTRTPRERPHPGRERRWAGVTQSSPAPYPSCQPLPASLFGHSPGCPLPFLTWPGGPLADPQPCPWLHEWPRSSSVVRRRPNKVRWPTRPPTPAPAAPTDPVHQLAIKRRGSRRAPSACAARAEPSPTRGRSR